MRSAFFTEHKNVLFSCGHDSIKAYILVTVIMFYMIMALSIIGHRIIKCVYSWNCQPPFFINLVSASHARTYIIGQTVSHIPVLHL